MTILQALDVEHHYHRRCVLRLDRLELAPGSITGLVGPNGSGKSTLLRILSFVERPLRGRLVLEGKPVFNRRERKRARRRVTLVEQQPFLFRGTVTDNLLYALRLGHQPDISARASAALERVGVSDLADRPARRLSEGERQKIALARALALAPAVLLLDEPTSAADRASAAVLYRILAEEKARGVAVCLASHQLEDAYRWSDEILALADGQLTPVTPENVFRVHLVPGSGVRSVRTGPLDVYVVSDRSGPATLAIPPSEIVLSLTPQRSSARNQFPGVVTRVSQQKDGAIGVTVDVGVDLLARITRTSLDELGITIGAPVFVSFKAVAVRVF